MPIRIGVQTQGERPFTPLTSIYPSAFSSQFDEIKDLERLHSGSPLISTSPALTPANPLLLSTNPHQLPNAAAVAPSLSTFDLAPTADGYILALDSHRVPPHLAQQAARGRAFFPRRHQRRYSIRQLLRERPSSHANIGPVDSLAPQPSTLPVEPHNSNPRRPAHSAAYRVSVDGVPRVMSTTSSNRPETIYKRCTVFAFMVQVGDVLNYGNELNDGCRVTDKYPDERVDTAGLENDDDDDDDGDASNRASGGSARSEDSEGNGDDDLSEGREVVLQPVRLNGTIRIQWEDKNGDLSSQLFEGLERLEVLRECDEGEESEITLIGPLQQDWIADWTRPTIVRSGQTV